MSTELERMTAHRAVFFLERFKREEKMLGPNEQAALDFAITLLACTHQPEAGQAVAWRWRPSMVFPGWVYSDDPARVSEARKFMGDGGVQALVLPAAQQPAQVVPEGFVLVPVEPTDEMLCAGFGYWLDVKGSPKQRETAKTEWAAMLAASQHGERAE